MVNTESGINTKALIHESMYVFMGKQKTNFDKLQRNYQASESCLITVMSDDSLSPQLCNRKMSPDLIKV